MATLSQRIIDLATRIATEIKSLRNTTDGKIGDLASLSTTQKASLVASLNELKALIDSTSAAAGASIDDSSSSTSKTWSASKISAAITQAAVQVKADLVGTAGPALDTLGEIVDQLRDDESQLATLLTAVGNRLRFDAPQTLTTPQKQQARTNIDAFGSVEIGTPDTDFATLFNSAVL